MIEFIELKNNSVNKVLGLFLLLITQSFLIKGQSQDLDKMTFLSGFHFSVTGSSGFTKFNFDQPTNITIKSPLLTQNSADLEVQYYLNKGLYLSASLGYLITTQKNYRMQRGMEWYNYRDGLAWLDYRKFDFGLGITRFLNSNLLLRPKINFGGIHNRFPYSLIRIQDGSTIQISNRFSPYLLAKVNLGFILRKHNAIDVGIYFRKSFNNIYSGTYVDNPEPIAFYGTGTELGLNMGYIFTGYRRRKAKSLGRKQFKEYKKSYREIEEKAKLLEVSIERFSFVHKINDPEGILVNSISNNIGFRMDVEIGLTKNKFWETGLHVGQYFVGYVLLDENKEFKVLQRQVGPDYQAALNIGYGYRITINKGINLAAISAGVTLNGSLSGSSGVSSLFDPSTNEFIYLIEYEDETKSVVYPSIYANFNKDFQITSKMRLSFNVRYNQGIIKSVVRRYNVQTYGSQTRNFTGIRNGTSYSLGIGMKYNFGERKTRDNMGPM